MIVKNVRDALDNAAHTDTWAVGMCGQFCAAMYGYGFSGYRDAITQWQSTPSGMRHPNDTEPPAGALVFWGGGSAGHGHVAIADGVGSVYSIDIAGAGTVARVPTGTITLRWGLPYLGWALPYFQGQPWSPVMIKGVDVSRYQADSGWESGIDFGFVKVTQGTSYVNSSWVAQRDTVRSVGAVVGYYHFLEHGNVVPQADYFLSKIALKPGDVLACDWETDPNTNTGAANAEKDAWISYVKGKTGHRVILYCNKDYWLNRDTTGYAGDGLWIATAGAPAGSPGIKAPWLIHQFSTAGNLDHDVAQFGSRAEMLAWAGGGEADMPLNDTDKAWISGEIKKQLGAALSATSLVDGKAHGLGYYAAHGEQDIAAIAAQAKANGSSLTSIMQFLNSLDLAQFSTEISDKIAALKFVISSEQGA